MEELMKDLNVKNFDELYEYLNDENHQDEPLVKEIKEFLNYVQEKSDVLWKIVFINILTATIKRSFI